MSVSIYWHVCEYVLVHRSSACKNWNHSPSHASFNGKLLVKLFGIYWKVELFLSTCSIDWRQSRQFVLPVPKIVQKDDDFDRYSEYIQYHNSRKHDDELLLLRFHSWPTGYNKWHLIASWCMTCHRDIINYSGWPMWCVEMIPTGKTVLTSSCKVYIQAYLAFERNNNISISVGGGNGRFLKECIPRLGLISSVARNDDEPQGSCFEFRCTDLPWCQLKWRFPCTWNHNYMCY